METFGDRLTATFSRAVTRRTMLQRAMRWGAASAAAGASLTRVGSAQAYARCQFHESSGCYCGPSPGCGTSKCYGDSCTNGAKGRCDAWTTLPYCWCTAYCHYGQSYAYYSCCDCWKYGNYGSCGSGNTRCICWVWICLNHC